MKIRHYFFRRFVFISTLFFALPATPIFADAESLSPAQAESLSTAPRVSVSASEPNEIDFFGPEEPTESQSKPAVKKGPVRVSSPTEEAASNESTPPTESLELEWPPFPSDGLMTLRTARIATLNAKLQAVLAAAKLGELSPLDWLRFSPYAQAAAALDRSRPMAAVYSADGPQSEPVVTVYLPVTDFRRFAEGLGGDFSGRSIPLAEGELVALSKIPGWVASSHGGFALLMAEKDRNAMATPVRVGPDDSPPLPSGLVSPDITLEVSRAGIRYGQELVRRVMADGFPVLKGILRGLELGDGGLVGSAPQPGEWLRALTDWTDQNIDRLRFDVTFAPGGLIFSGLMLPRPGSEAAASVAFAGGEMTTGLNPPRFLQILPEFASPLSGQMEIAPELAAHLEPPFDRLRHVEYSFMLPAEGELLAESWAFLLEVDDTDLFVREMIVPKARRIGSTIGSDRLGELGGKILGNLAARRQSRGRRPILGSPEEVAALGASLGSELGGSLGADLGEQEGLKTVDFQGQPMYVSDLVLYTRQMREIRARARGELGPPPIFLTGEPTLRILIGTVLSGLQTGSLEGMIRERFMGGLGASPNEMLLARENLTLILGPRHVLMVPGNRDVLRAAQDEWFGNPGPQPPRFDDWMGVWDVLCTEMNGPESQTLRSATRLDLRAAGWLADTIRAERLPGLPKLFDSLDDQTPPWFSVTTTAGDASLFYTAIPNGLIRAVSARFLKKNPAKAE